MTFSVNKSEFSVPNGLKRQCRLGTKRMSDSDSDVERQLVDREGDIKKKEVEPVNNPESDVPKCLGIPIKYLALVVLTLQNASQMLLMRYAKMPREGQGDYLSTTAVVMQELLKLIACIIIITATEGFSGMIQEIKTKVILNWKDTLLVGVPAGVYMVQNNLLYVAMENLDAAVCQVAYQLKLLTTAMFAVTMLGKKLGCVKWAILVLLTTGVIVVQLPNVFKKDNHGTEDGKDGKNNPVVGLIAVLTACCLSGFAGIYFEKILKGAAKVSLWIRNIQLGFFGFVLGIGAVYIKDGDKVAQDGFFQNYWSVSWIVILLVAFGGLTVAVVVKYADNILKGFATSISIVIGGVVSAMIPSYEFEMDPFFIAGSLIVVVATVLYSKF